MKGVVKSYVIRTREPTDPISFMKLVKPKVLSETFRQETKVYISLKCVMKKVNAADGVEVTDETHFRSRCQKLFDESEYDFLYDEMTDRVLENFAKYQRNGSGWRLKRIEHLDVRVLENKPLKGASYIPLPEKLKNKRAIINMKNDDNMCFKWAVTRALNPVERNPGRITKVLKEQSKQYNWEGIDFPTTLRDIRKFEKNNNVFVNVFGFDDDKKCVYPLRNPKGDCRDRGRLMLIGDSTESHYTVVKCMSRLLQGQATKKKCKRFYCDNCLNGFTTEETLREHETYCNSEDCVGSKYPKEGSYVSFKNHSNTVRHPFVIYADFECFTSPVESVTNDPNKAYTTVYQKHEPSGFCYYVKCSEEGVYDKKPVTYTKESERDDVPKRFVERLENTFKEIVDQSEEDDIWKGGEESV